MTRLRILFKHPWAICFAITIVVWLLQVIPIAGVFLMIVGPALTVVTLNLGFILLFFSAYHRDVPRAMMALPTIWFGGYMVLAAYSHWVVAELDEQVRAENGSAKILFDPQSNDIIVAAENGFPGLVGDYDLNSVLTIEKTCGGFERHTVTAGKCRRKSREVDGCRESAIPHRSHSGMEMCWETEKASPTRPALTIEDRTDEVENLWYTGHLHHLSVRSPTGDVARVTTGWVKPLAWFPIPIAGCGLVSGGPNSGWRCYAFWWRGEATELAVGPAGNAEVDVLAKLLGLELR